MDEIILNASKVERQQGILREEKIQETIETPVVKERTFRLPQKKIDELTKMYSHVVVRDFGDDYHKTPEQLAQENQFAEYQKKIGSMKNRYTRIEPYIEAMRICWEFLWKLAEANSMVMKPKKFVTWVLRGKIKVNGFQFPRYKGRDRKTLNMRVVWDYIVDTDKDPHDLTIFNDIDSITKDEMENPEKYLDKYFTPEEIQRIFVDAKKMKTSTILHDEEIDGHRFGVVRKASRKQQKKLYKCFPDLEVMMKDLRRKHDVDSALRDFAYDLDNDAFTQIADMDEKRGFFTEDRIPVFKGDLMNKDDYKKYLYRLDEFEKEHTRVNYHGRFITLEEYEETRFRECLEEAGYNVMNMYGNKAEMKAYKKAQKADKKKEKRLRKELSRLQGRQNTRDGDPLKINTKKKKDKSKKKDKKGKKKNKGNNPEIDKVFLKAAKRSEKDFDEYEQRMLDMSWGFKPGE